MRMLGLLCASIVATLAWISSAAATLPRTYVASNGDNANLCTRAAPCADFQTAHDKTDAGGEVTCLDNFDFGSLTITKSITIDCGGAAIVNTASVAVTINTANVDVILRGLIITGNGSGDVGIQFQNGASLHIQNCQIRGFGSNRGTAINFVPVTGISAKLHVVDTLITKNGNNITHVGGGMNVQPAGTGSARVVVERTTIEDSWTGILVNGSTSTNMVSFQLKDSTVANSNANGASVLTAPAGATIGFVIDRSSFLLNASDGVFAQGPLSFVLLGNSTVASNGTGLHATNGGHIFSYQNNQVKGNVTDNAPTGVLPIQ